MRKGLEHISEPYRGVLVVLLEGLRRVFGEKLVSVVVYGSVARGEPTLGSDIDVLVVVESLPRRRLKRQELFEQAERYVEHYLEDLRGRGYNIDFSPILLTPEEAARHRPLYLDMIVDGVIVYDKGGFMERVLGEVAARLRELGAKRVKLGRKWYWVLKEDYEPGEVIEV